MILNKASAERGFAHATVYKSEVGGAGGWVGGQGRWVGQLSGGEVVPPFLWSAVDQSPGQGDGQGETPP